MKQLTNQTRAQGDTDRHWQLGAEGARRVLERRNQTGRTQPLSQLSAEMAADILAAPPTPAPQKAAPRQEDLPKVMIDPSLASAALPPVPVPTAVPATASGPVPRPDRHEWMFSRESSGPPKPLDAAELAATARPFAAFFQRVGRLFRN